MLYNVLPLYSFNVYKIVVRYVKYIMYKTCVI